MRSDIASDAPHPSENGHHSRRNLHLSTPPFRPRLQKRKTLFSSPPATSLQCGDLSATNNESTLRKKGNVSGRSRDHSGHSKSKKFPSGSEPQEDVPLDRFGCVPYERVYNFDTSPNVIEGVTESGSSKKKSICTKKEGKTGANKSHLPELDVPWHLREVSSNPVCDTFDFLGTKYFWFLVQFSMRVTLLGMLIPAALIAANVPHSSFIFSVHTLPAVVVGASTTFGGSATFVVQFLKAAFIWLPLATICAVSGLYRSVSLWFVVYLLLMFLIACLVKGVARRFSLLLLNISMVGQLHGFTDLLFPLQLLLNWFVGLMFALVATFVPYPTLATRHARSVTRRLFSNTATAFRGLLTCFWASSNTERSMGMVRVRQVTRSLDSLLEVLENLEKLTLYEVFLKGCEGRRVRLEKAELLDRLRLNLRFMTRVIDIVQDNPGIICDSVRCTEFVTSLSRPMEGISRAVEELLDRLSDAQSRRELLELEPFFEACGCTIKKLQEEFNGASYRYFYEGEELNEMEEFVPLMTFFVFSVVNFWHALDEFHHEMRTEALRTKTMTLKTVWNKMTEIFFEKVDFFRKVFVTHSETELRLVLESSKLSVSMLLSMLFFYYVQPNLMPLSGPTVIALVSGTNAVQAVQAAGERLTGILFGSVIGFFAASLGKTKVDMVVSICVITVLLTFFSTGKKYGTSCMFANFVAISGLSLEGRPTADMVISRIQQNTFAIVIYCLLSVLVLPVSPGKILMRRRVEILQSVSRIVATMMEFYGDPLSKESCGHSSGCPTPQRLWANETFYMSNNHNNDETITTVNSLGNVNGNTDAMSLHLTRVPVFMRTPEPDACISALFEKLWELKHEMRESALVMPFAADERGIKPMEYPQKSCEAVHSALYRIFALIYTMACSWKLMREKDYFTNEVWHIMRYVYPVATDIRLGLQRFVNLLSFYLDHPSSSLASELMRCLMQFRALVVEFTERKYRALLKIISSVRQQREGAMKRVQSAPHDVHKNGALGTADCSAPDASETGDNGTALMPPVENFTLVFPSPKKERGAVGKAEGTAPSPRRQTAPGPPRANHKRSNSPCGVGDEAVKKKKKNSATKEEQWNGIKLSVSFPHEARHAAKQHERDGEDGEEPASSASTSPNSLTAPRSDGSASFDSFATITSQLAESFSARITMHDAEGLHSITLALDMLGKELKNALLAFEDMVQMKNQ